MNTIGISVISNRTHITLMAEDILYLSLSGRKTAIHITEFMRPIPLLMNWQKILAVPLSAWIDAISCLPRQSTM